MSDFINDLNDTPLVEETVVDNAPVIEEEVIEEAIEEVAEVPVAEPVIEAVVEEVKPKAKKSKEEKAVEPTTEKVALFSTRNVSWDGVGKIFMGYNLVEATEAEQWLTRSHVRLATPKEILEKLS